MPVVGSDPLLGLTKADELLKNAGYPQGDIYLITDGINKYDQENLQEFIQQHPHRLSI